MTHSPGNTNDILGTDVVVIGAGAAGLTVALGLAPRRVALLTKARFGSGGATAIAQGGIAAAMGAEDTPALHARDTLDAGAGLTDAGVAEILTSEGPERIRQLAALGARFDRTVDGRLALGREAAHSRPRIVHADGDATGAEVVRALTAAVRAAPHVTVEDEVFAEDLVVRDGCVAGVVARRRDGRTLTCFASAVVLATGGVGQVYARTTNPPEATGDGLALAARAGALLADLEFVQFHPTALDVPADPLPLVTEALRGHGATLVDEDGRRFMLDVHPQAELAPRDVVARAIWQQRESGREVYLDAREAAGTEFPSRFPTVFELCRRHRLDPRRERIPVTPAAHYHMGGVATDERGRSSVPGLWVCGEAASTGVHGANRLASNSLLEGLVFGKRVADDVSSAIDGTQPPSVLAARAPTVPSVERGPDSADAATMVKEVRSFMWRYAGLVRTEAGLRRTGLALDHMSTAAWQGEPRNLLLVARLITAAALARTESRGSHFRPDFPEPSPAWQRRLYFCLNADGRIVGVRSFQPFALSTADAP